QGICPASRVERETLLRPQALMCDDDLRSGVDLAELDRHERLAAGVAAGAVPRPRVDEPLRRLDLLVDAAHGADLAARLDGQVPRAADAQVDGRVQRHGER